VLRYVEVHVHSRPRTGKQDLVSVYCFQKAGIKIKTKEVCAKKININIYLCIIKEQSIIRFTVVQSEI
jgi:hypothetical protein